MSRTDADVWLNYLNAVGILLHFPDVDGLEDIIILNPNWARIMAYKVLDSELVITNGGEFTKDDCDTIWPNSNIHFQLISLLKKIELCYEIKINFEIKYLVPALFPNDYPDKFPAIEKLSGIDSLSKVNIECLFSPIIPPGLLYRLIFRQHSFIYKLFRSKKGVVFFLENENTFSEIKEHWKDNSISICLHGSRVDFLVELILNEIQLIIKEIKKNPYFTSLKYSINVLCNCEKRQKNVNMIILK